jgi:predicted HTH domain antitoxin
MQKAIHVKYPESLATALKLNTEEFEKEMKMSSLVKLYELGRVSSGTAAKVLGISRIDFLDQLANYKVSLFNFSGLDEVNEDIANA